MRRVVPIDKSGARDSSIALRTADSDKQTANCQIWAPPPAGKLGSALTVCVCVCTGEGGWAERKSHFEKYFAEFSSSPIVVSSSLRHAQTRFYDDTRGSN